MKRHTFKLLFVILLFIQQFSSAQMQISDHPIYLNHHLPIEKRVQDLISRLTIEEKAKLLNHRATDLERFHIKSDKWNQCLNGVKWDKPTTLFPICLAMSATWDTALIYRVATVLSDEARAIYNGWHIDTAAKGEHKGLIYRAPVINIERNPYWGRNHEAWGEDPCLTGRMAVSYVKGLQGNDPHYLKIAATLKHFAVNNVETDRTKLNANVSERMLREYWLPHWEDAVKEGKATSLMASYNAINQVHNNINHFLLTDILKDEWQHEGFVVSDLGGVKSMVEDKSHGVMTYEEAVAKSLMAGCDFSDKEFEQYIPAAIKGGMLTEERLNVALTRVLNVRFRLGDFDPFNAVPYSTISPDTINCATHRKLALKVAEESIVLLKNKSNLLPLDKKKLKRIAIIGPLAERVLKNNYNGKSENIVTALQGIKEYLGNGVEVNYSIGGDVGGHENVVHWVSDTLGITPVSAKAQMNAVELAKNSDVVILFVGTTSRIEQESRDRKTLGLTGSQEELAEAVLAVNPHTIVVEMSAGPLTIPWIAEHAPSILQAWWPGEEGGHAIANVLFGEVNPSGRLPHTVYASEAQVPPVDEYDISKGFTYMYLKGKPLYAFGYGLSYTQFAYSNMKVLDGKIKKDGVIKVSVDIKNIGKRTGSEVVQLYTHQLKSALVRPAKELHTFSKVSLQPNETKTVTMTFPSNKLGYFDEKMHQFVLEQGIVELMIGSSSVDIKLKKSIQY